MTAPDITALRRQVLSHCLWMATMDEEYARQAASDYEAIDREIFKGLRARFDSDLSRQKVDRRAASPSMEGATA